MKITFEDLDISEIMRYMGYKNQKQSDEFYAFIEETVKESLEIVKPKAIHQVFPIQWEENDITILGTTLSFEGKAIRAHLENCNQIALMAATLGVQMDQILRTTSKFDLTKSLILEAAATEIVEKVCDQEQRLISKIAQEKGLKTTDRFSPGYGDLPIEIQSNFLNVLDATRKIGLTCTENSTMIPTKSVTAIIGFYNGESREEKTACEFCQLYEYCQYRKDGNYCGHPKTS